MGYRNWNSIEWVFSDLFVKLLHFAVKAVFKIIQMNTIFKLARRRNLVVNNKDIRMYLSRNYRPDKLDVLKTNIFALEAKYLF